MKIFIQGRKDGYNTLYPKPTPAEFFQFAADIQRIDAQNNAQYYGKSLYSIAFNGNGCIFTKYIIGYDTLRSNIGNIGISVFIPNNQKILGIDIKTLLDELISIYTTNYCPDFKINNQKQEDWLLFSSTADNYDIKVKTILSDENFLYGNKDAAYIIYDNNTEIEKYLDAPYQAEYKEFKQILFIDNQSRLLLEVIKHDQTETANLTGKIDLDNPSYKLREYHGQGKNGVSIEIRANGKLRNNKEKIFRKDIITIKYSKKYHKDIFEEGKLTDPQIEKYLIISDNSIDVDKNFDLPKTEIPVEIRICNSKGESISDAIISCKNNYSKTERNPVSQNTFVFLGEEQKDKWTVYADKEGFIGEETFIPEFNSVVKLTLREVKIIKLRILDEKGDLITNKSKELPFYDDEIRREHTEHINIQSYHFEKVTFIPKDVAEPISVKLIKQVSQKPQDTSQGKGRSPETDNNEIFKSKNRKKTFYIKILLGLSIACLLVFTVYCLTLILWDRSNSNGTHQQQTSQEQGLPILTPADIISYVDGDSLFLEKLEEYNEDWANLKSTTDKATYEKYKGFIDEAIQKREALEDGNFAFLKDSNVNYTSAQKAFKTAVYNLKQDQFDNVKAKLVDVSNLTLRQIADSITKILALPKDTKASTEKNGGTQLKKAGSKQSKNKSELTTNDETPIIEYLKGHELKGNQLNEYKKKKNISKKLETSIDLALEFWSLNGDVKSTKAYKSKVTKDEYLKNNKTLKEFLEKAPSSKYPKNTRGAANLKLSDLAK